MGGGYAKDKGMVYFDFTDDLCVTATLLPCLPGPLGAPEGVSMRSKARKSGRENASNGHYGPYSRIAASGAILFLVFGAVGCVGSHPREESARRDAEPSLEPGPHAEVAGSVPGKRFEEPAELDKLLDAKPIALAAVKPASQSQPGGASPKAAEPASKGKGNFRIQVGAESDVDAAQAKKAEYEKLLGGNVDVVFDAPYYKLRWGYFDSKQDAEDKILELTDFKIQGFVVKQ